MGIIFNRRRRIHDPSTHSMKATEDLLLEIRDRLPDPNRKKPVIRRRHVPGLGVSLGNIARNRRRGY